MQTKTKSTRVRLDNPPEKSGGIYDYEEPEVKEFIPSGCTLLDQILGGGWAMRRVSNIIGDKSTNKTGNAIEACINFAIKYPKNKSQIYYREAEAAFDRGYAGSRLGLPVDRIDFLPKYDTKDRKKVSQEFRTVEDFQRDIEMIVERHSGTNAAILYIMDSMDGLSDEAELKRDTGEGSYGAAKAKQMSEFFRKRTQDLFFCNMHLMVISQIRDNIGVKFGKKTTRSGGHALDFYASQIIELAMVGRVNKTIGGITRAVGIDVLAKCTKNKITTPFQECKFPVIFNYGIDNIRSSLEWIENVKYLKDYGDTVAIDVAVKQCKATNYVTAINKLSDEKFRLQDAALAIYTAELYQEINQRFEPKRRKYR